MCEAVACYFVGQYRPLAEFLYFISGILLLVGIVVAYLTYRSARQTATFRNTIDKFASYRNERDMAQIGRVRELIDTGALAGQEYVPGTLAAKDVECIRFVLNEWEEIALCVRYKIYSEQVLFEHYGRLGLSFWTALRPYIRFAQRTRPTLWAEFDRLAVQWMVRTTAKDQSPAQADLKRILAELDAVLLRLARK